MTPSQGIKKNMFQETDKLRKVLEKISVNHQLQNK